MSELADEFSLQLARKVEEAKESQPLTKQVYNRLEAIEKALAQGVHRAEIAELFSVSLQQFAAALAGARRLKRNGGDRRRAVAKREIGQMRRALQPALATKETHLNEF
jgi:hypothetical protein